MTELAAVQTQQGAVLAPDNIPLHFGDQLAEYQAGLTAAILLDRSHEARLRLDGSSALGLLHRISTNDVEHLAADSGCPTIFTNAHARVLDRVTVFRRSDAVLLLGEPGRAQPLQQYVQRNIFFGDDVQIADRADQTRAFDLHGPQATQVLGQLAPELTTLPLLAGCAVTVAEAPVYVVRRQPVSEQRWTLIVPEAEAATVWQQITAAGTQPAGSLVYNVLRVRAGRPSVGRELTTDYIPLEIGLWDEVSFSKGCYTGQEIIARMESRNRLAKILVTLDLAQPVDAPAEIFAEGRSAGQLTSSVTAPDGMIYALGVIKTPLAEPGNELTVGAQQVRATVKALAGSTTKTH
jgi:tRNA-modifying protein YgfZ